MRYSPRPGTPAAGMGTQVPADVSLARLHALQALLLEQQLAFNKAQVGRTLDVLFEKKGRHGRQALVYACWGLRPSRGDDDPAPQIRNRFRI